VISEPWIAISDSLRFRRGCRCCTNRPATVPYPLFTGISYQLDLTTPGISPLSASERKHKRHTPNLRRNPRGRPQSWHRLCLRQL